MGESTPLITAIVLGLCLAFIFGAIANRLRISPLVGYLLAGLIVGPNTPGFHADSSLVNQLAEIGIVLLMFGVGLRFSLKELLSVRKIAIPGAAIQICCTTLLGTLFGYLVGWNLTSAIVFGLALTGSSTVVFVRTLQDRNLLETNQGRVAMGWLVVQDVMMVAVLVLLPVLAGTNNAYQSASNSGLLTPLSFNQWLESLMGTSGLILAVVIKVALFIALMVLVARRMIPKILQMAAQTGSRELFSLAVLVIALGVAFGAAELFEVSLALGAFFAGMIMGETKFSHRATEGILPLRDAFAVLFFVSVGMLFQPDKLIEDSLPLLVVLIIIVVGNSLTAYFLLRIFKQPLETALTLFAGLAQIGEFSFILANFGSSLGILSTDARDYIIGAAIISILINPLFFVLASKLNLRLKTQNEAYDKVNTASTSTPAGIKGAIQTTPPHSEKEQHTIIVGYNSIGENIAAQLHKMESDFVIIENIPHRIDKARKNGYEVINGNGADKSTLVRTNISEAENFILTSGKIYKTMHIADLAKELSPSIYTIARIHNIDDKALLAQSNIDNIVADNQQIATALLLLLSKNGNIKTNVAHTDSSVPEDYENHEDVSSSEKAVI